MLYLILVTRKELRVKTGTDQLVSTSLILTPTGFVINGAAVIVIVIRTQKTISTTMDTTESLILIQVCVDSGANMNIPVLHCLSKFLDGLLRRSNSINVSLRSSSGSFSGRNNSNYQGLWNGRSKYDSHFRQGNTFANVSKNLTFCGTAYGIISCINFRSLCSVLQGRGGMFCS